MGRFMSPDPDGAGSLEQDLQMNWNGGAADNGSLIGLKAAGQQNFNRTYSYDSLNRLAAMSDSNTSQQCRGLSWTYDAWGNRTDQTQTAGTCNSFHQSVNTKNQLVDTINNTLQYDAAGNMTYDGNHSYTYDAENRLIQVDGGSTASYVYDAVGHRVTKTVSGAWRDYLYDTSGNVVAETTSGGWNVGYAYLGGQLLAQYSNSTTYFVHQDHLGSTRLRTTLSQSVYDSFDYLPFGELLSGAGDYVHKFTGDERDDETGLDHTWFRQYSSSLGRWMHPDPAGLAAVDPSNPQSWNRYAYVDDDPLNLTDSSGLYPVCLGSSLFDQVDFYVDEKYQGSDLTYIGNLCGDQGQRLPPDRSGLLIHGGGGGGGGSGRGGGNGSGDNWWGTFAKEFFKLSGGPGNVPTCAGEALKQIAA